MSSLGMALDEESELELDLDGESELCLDLDEAGGGARAR
jgi:hypothetical protein